MIEVKNVTKKYGNFVAADNLNFSIKKGEIVGLLGPNGAGKSTTMNMITGFIEPTQGEVEICGYSMSKKPKKAKSEIGYMPEGVPLYVDLTPKEFVRYMAELKKVPRKIIKSEVDEILGKTGLKNVEDKLIRNLSRGYKQRVSMAGAMVGKPQILILDEPTVGLDPKQITEIRALISELSKEHTIIISSHILAEIGKMCSKVIIMTDGKIVKIDTPENLANNASENKIIVIVEDEKNKIQGMKSTIKAIKKIKLVDTNTEENTKQYEIEIDGSADIRKEISVEFAKSGIIIFEMKKLETSLENAFMKTIEGGKK